jgi:hypothetical protein
MSEGFIDGHAYFFLKGIFLQLVIFWLELYAISHASVLSYLLIACIGAITYV